MLWNSALNSSQHRGVCCLLLLLLLTSALQSICAQEKVPCLTALGVKGRCVAWKECPLRDRALVRPEQRLTLKEMIAQRAQTRTCKLGEVCCELEAAVATGVRLANDTNCTTQDSPSCAKSGHSSGVPTQVTMDDPRLKLLPLSLCGVSVVNYIVGGSRAEQGRFPWMALLCSKKGSEPGRCFCAGTVITTRHVLTAASCIVDLPPGAPKPSMVMVGDVDSNRTTATQARWFNVARTKVHPSFNPALSREHDLALLELDKDVIFDEDHVRPVCLPVGRIQVRNLDSVSDLIVAAWGTEERHSHIPSSMSRFLQFVNMLTVPNAECANIYRGRSIIAPSMVCAGRGHDGPCRGDTGAPLMMMDTLPGAEEMRIVQVGVSSWNPSPCATPNTPGIYTRLGFYLLWILENIM